MDAHDYCKAICQNVRCLNVSVERSSDFFESPFISNVEITLNELPFLMADWIKSFVRVIYLCAFNTVTQLVTRRHDVYRCLRVRETVSLSLTIWLMRQHHHCGFEGMSCVGKNEQPILITNTNKWGSIRLFTHICNEWWTFSAVKCSNTKVKCIRFHHNASGLILTWFLMAYWVSERWFWRMANWMDHLRN